MDQLTTDKAIVSLDAWLESMRGTEGYTGPVVHWWQNCLRYAGVGLDWRYEAIIVGYLSLYQRTRHQGWLDKARRAGDDLVSGQLRSGSFKCSSFELNPNTGGTPHEAACNVGLLALARVLREREDSSETRYLVAAQRNIEDCLISRLWDGQARSFRDHPLIPSLVPNKAATIVEALISLAELTGERRYVEDFAMPTLDAILDRQISDGALSGAIFQYESRGESVAWYFPFYIARCLPALVKGYVWSGESRYLDGARAAARFVLDQRKADGSFPQVVYPRGRLNRYPAWIAGVGDILRCVEMLVPYGLEADLEPTRVWFLSGQLPSGGFRTAHGFASQISQRAPGPIADFRDLLPVVGWSSMAFRYLASRCSTDLTQGDSRVADWATDCFGGGMRSTFAETGSSMSLSSCSETLYRWTKGDDWAECCSMKRLWK